MVELVAKNRATLAAKSRARGISDADLMGPKRRANRFAVAHRIGGSQRCSPWICNVAKGNEKGHTENSVKRAQRTSYASDPAPQADAGTRPPNAPFDETRVR